MTNKIIVSLTSTKARIGTLSWTLDSIYAQTLQPSEVRLYAESAVVEQEGLRAYPSLRCIATEDRGPITKISAIGDPDLDDDALVVTIDDDIVYHPCWLETLVAGARENPGAAVGFSGWDVRLFLEDPINGTYWWPADPGERDVIEGWAGVAYRKSFLDVAIIMAPPPPLFRHVDDVWISWQLHRKGTSRVTLVNPPCGIVSGRPGALPGLSSRPDFIKLNRDAVVASFGSQT